MTEMISFSPDTRPPTAEEKRASRRLFGGTAEFKIGATDPGHFPRWSIPEIAFVGRSNVGKSSLLNRLTHRRHLARVSHTPGRTRQVNFFLLADRLSMVDLPGYGYAKISHKDRNQWDHLLQSYLTGRSCLRRLFLLIDTEVGPKENDREMWSYLDHWGLPYQIIGTKADKASTEQRQKLEEDFAHLASCHGAMHPHLLLTSARKDEGIVGLQTTILREILGR